MSIAAKCICGESLYFCIGVGKCPYAYSDQPPFTGWDVFKESKERVKKEMQIELISNLKSTTVILPK